MYSDKEVEDLVETIMRATNCGSYEAYTDEKAREKWKKFVTEEEVNDDETVVRECGR